MPAEELPLECLQLIIAHLDSDNDTRSLSTLLRVSKHFCAAILPILYSNPFRRELHSTTSESNKTSPTSVIKLVNLLLRCAKPDTVTDLLKASYNQKFEYNRTVGHETRVEPPSSGINYLRFLQHFYSLESDLPSSFLFQNDYISDKATSTDFLNHLGLQSRYHSQELIFHNLRQSAYLLKYLATDLRVQLTWAICSSTLENIQSLVIPLSDIHRYNAVVHRFKNLVHVTFKLDKLEYSSFFQMNLLETDPQRHADLQRERTESLEAMIRFVKSHVTLFPHQLQCANCPDDDIWQGNPQKCPELYQTQLQDHLPSLDKPRVLDKNNWARFLAKVETTDLSQVEIIRAPCSDPNRWFSSLRQKQSTFLQRCRNLKELEMISLGSETFTWATSESYNLFNWNFMKNGHRLLWADPSDYPDPPPIQPLYPLIPLEHLRLWSYWAPIISEINDILLAFTDTIVTIFIRDAYHIPSNASLIEDESSLITIGSCIHPDSYFLKLREVIIILPRQEVVFPADIFEAFRKLEYLKIEDGLSMYSCDPTLLNPNNLGWSKLYIDALAFRSIKLQGRSALCFHPECFHHTPDLRVLHLGIKMTDGQSYIPRVKDILHYEYDSKDQEALDRKAECDYYFDHISMDDSVEYEGPVLMRPYWSWDWNLPNLQTLQMTGEFAWRFKFKMLVGSPNLENLILNMATIGDSDMVNEPEDRQDRDQNETQQDQPTFEHQRNIQARDFLLPTDSHGGRNSDIYLQTPKLKSLYIRGRWFLSDETLQVMLLSVMPNLQTLTESQCLGFTIGAWVRITGQLTSLETASSTRIVKEDRLAEVGLAKHTQDLDRASRFRVVEENINGGVRRKVVAAPDGSFCAMAGSGQILKTIYTFDQRDKYFKI
ncbi:hypothetical protein BGX26_003966, partial [Mortierella sp. AD094]